MDKKTLTGLIFAIGAVFVLVISLSMPWFTHNEKTVTKVDGDIEDKDETTTRFFLNSGRGTYHTGEEPTDNRTSTWENTMTMNRIGIISAILSVIFIALAIDPEKKTYKRLGIILLVVGIIFTLIAPIYLMTSQPGAIKDDRYSGDEEVPDHDSPAKSFFGSYENTTTEESYGTIYEETIEENWGGGMGWFMSLTAGIFLIISLILVALGGRSKDQRRAVREDESMQQPPQQVPPEQPGQTQQEPEWEEDSQQIEEEPNLQQEEGVAPVRQQQVQEEPQQAQQTNTCPDCGQPIRYIEEYDSWYCDNCQEYK